MSPSQLPEVRAEKLVEHAAFMRAIARAILAREDLAEDAVQDTLAAALGRGSRERGRLRSWLGGIVRHKALDIRRRESRRDARHRAASAREAAPDPAALAEQADVGRRLTEYVLALPEPYRDVLLYRYYHGMPVRDVASLLDVPVETVRTRQRRALVRLRTTLAAKGGGDWRPLLVPLAAGPSWGGGGALPTVLGGALVAKKIAVAACVVCVVLAGVWWAGEGAGKRREEDSGPPQVREASWPTTGDDPSPRLAGKAAAPSEPAEGQASPATKGRYGGTLLDEEGRPVPGAWLQVQAPAYVDVDVAGLPPIVPDEAGRFAFDVPGARAQIPVRIHAQTHVPAWGGKVQYVFPGQPAKLVLVRGVPLELSVVDDVTEASVSEAKAGVYDPNTLGATHWRSARPQDEASTDGAGRATLRTRTGRRMLLVRAAGYRAALVADLDVPEAGRDVQVRLGRGGTVRGRLVDEAGRPKPGVRIDAMGYPWYEARAVSDADGRFVLSDTPLRTDPPAPGRSYHLRLWSQVAGSGSARFLYVTPPEGPGETVDVELIWLDERPLEGRVFHADGRPAGGLTVTVRPVLARLLNWSAPPATTETDGRFRFERCVPGRVRVEVRQGGPTGRVLVGRETILASGGTTTSVELTLSPTAPGASPRLEVRLHDHGGGLIERGVLHWHVQRGSGVSTVSTELEQGRAILEAGVRPGMIVVASAPGFVPLVATLTEEDVVRGRVDLRYPSGVIEGRVVRLDETPVPVELAVRLVSPRPTSPVGIPRAGQPGHPTDENGRFVLRGVGEGAYEFRVPIVSWRLLGGRVLARAGEKDVRLVVGTEGELRDSFVEAVLMDGETGAPLTGWHLLLKLVPTGAPAEGDPVAVLQRVEGTVSLYRTFDPVAPGVYDVVLERMFGRREARAARVEVGAGIPRPRARLTWERGLGVSGRVLDAEGRPAAGVRVTAGGQVVVVKEDGSYRITGLDEGRVEVVLTGDYVEPRTRLVDVRAGEGGTADFLETCTGGAIRLLSSSPWPPLRRLTITLRPEGEGTPEAVDLTARELEERWVRRGIVVPFLEPGRWQVDVDWDGRRIASEVVVVRDLETTTFRISP